MVVPNAGRHGGGDQYQRYPQQQQYGHGYPSVRPQQGVPGHRQQQHEMVTDIDGLHGGKNHNDHTNPSSPDHPNDGVDDLSLYQNVPEYKGGELSRLASHIGKMLEPKPIIVHYKKKRPGQQTGNDAPAMPLSQVGEMAHAVPRGRRRVRNPPPRMTHFGPTQGEQQPGGRADGNEGGEDNAGFSCYYSRRPGEYLPDNRSDWRPVELRDDETTPLPWEHNHHGGAHTPLHANTSAKVTSQRSEPRDGIGGGTFNDNDQLPPMVLQTMLQYDDEEFIAAANTIMVHIEQREVAHMDRKISKMMAESSSIAVRGSAGNREGGDDGEGSISNSTLSSSDTVPRLIDDFGKGFIDAFLSALEFRVERTTTSGTSSNYSHLTEEETEMDAIVMEVKNMVDQHAAYFVAREEIREQVTTPNDTELSNIETDTAPEPTKRHSGFVPHADQSIAGYVPLEHITPRSKNTSAASKADEISIAKSFASTVKSAYEKIGETLKKSISREGGEANLQVKEESTNAFGRYIEPSNSALLDQSQRRQELVSEMQKLHAFIEKAGPMHSEVRRSCQHRIEELRTELEAMTLTVSNDTREDSLQRQAVVDEMKRVEHVFNSTRVEDVKDSCRVRLQELRVELVSLSPAECEGCDFTPSVAIVPSASSFSVQDAQNPVIHNASTGSASTGSIVKVGKERRHVKVMAPADLPGGCKFSAQLGNGEEFLATVPSGGVRKGEIFVSSVEEMQLGSSACGGCMSIMDYLYDKL